MDHNVAAAQRLFDDQERVGEQACREAASAAGLSATDADSCEDAQRRCPGCPWTRSQQPAQRPEGVRP
jgi:hypothetical protein